MTARANRQPIPSAFTLTLLLSVLVHAGLWWALARGEAQARTAILESQPAQTQILSFTLSVPAPATPAHTPPGMPENPSEEFKTERVAEQPQSPIEQKATPVPVPRPEPQSAQPAAAVEPLAKIVTTTRALPIPREAIEPVSQRESGSQPEPEPQSAIEPQPIQAREPNPAHIAEKTPSKFTTSAVAHAELPPIANPTPEMVAAEYAARQQSLRQQYLQQLTARINHHKFYPQRSRRRGEHGTVLVSLVLTHSGHVSEIRIAESSGYPQLDRAAIQTLKRVFPADPLPPELELRQWPLAVPVSYSLYEG